MTFSLTPPPRRFRAPDEPIIGAEGHTVGHFWRWAYSDLLMNTIRPVLVEYLAGIALDIVDETPRVEWDAVDFLYKGWKIEVKSSGYLQSCPQAALSQIGFDIALKKGWYAATNTYAPVASRAADLYVFALFEPTAHDGSDPLDARQWCFHVVARRDVDAAFGDRKRAGLSQLAGLGTKTAFPELATRINEVVASLELTATAELGGEG